MGKREVGRTRGRRGESKGGQEGERGRDLRVKLGVAEPSHLASISSLVHWFAHLLCTSMNVLQRPD